MSKAHAGGCSGTRPFFSRTPCVQFLAVLMTLIGATACSSVPPLAHAVGSPEALAAAVLDAIRTGDRARLDSLALRQEEFRDHVWPDLPAARPERNLPLSYVWGDLRQKSDQALSATLEQRAGRRYELRAVTFAGVTSYAHYRVHRDATFRVREMDGPETDIHVCGSMIEKDGGWKVFSYVVD